MASKGHNLYSVRAERMVIIRLMTLIVTLIPVSIVSSFYSTHTLRISPASAFVPELLADTTQAPGDLRRGSASPGSLAGALPRRLAGALPRRLAGLYSVLKNVYNRLYRPCNLLNQFKNITPLHSLPSFPVRNPFPTRI